MKHPGLNGRGCSSRVFLVSVAVVMTVAELDEAADEAPLTVKGSMGQQVISPLVA